MTAILGGSGSGKSTLMETVLARGISTRARVEGAIEVRVGAAGEQQPGRSITSLRALHRVRNLVGFMPQDDLVYEDLTVLENLLLSARYRVPLPPDARGWPGGGDARRCRLRIGEILELLRLAPVADQLVGGSNGVRGVSGGQRRRLSMGIELVHYPSAFFLDEVRMRVPLPRRDAVVGAGARHRPDAMCVYASLGS